MNFLYEPPFTLISHSSKMWATNVFALFSIIFWFSKKNSSNSLPILVCFLIVSLSLSCSRCRCIRFVCSCMSVCVYVCVQNQFKFILCFNKLPFQLANIVSLLWLLFFEFWFGTLSRKCWTNNWIMSKWNCYGIWLKNGEKGEGGEVAFRLTETVGRFLFCFDFHITFIWFRQINHLPTELTANSPTTIK